MAKDAKKPKTEPETPWQRFERLTRKIVRVPKEAIREPKNGKVQPQ